MDSRSFSILALTVVVSGGVGEASFNRDCSFIAVDSFAPSQTASWRWEAYDNNPGSTNHRRVASKQTNTGDTLETCCENVMWGINVFRIEGDDGTYTLEIPVWITLRKS